MTGRQGDPDGEVTEADSSPGGPEQYLLELGREVLEAQPFSKLLGTELRRLLPGSAELAVAVTHDLRQQHGYAHGGVTAYLVDNALTFAGGSVLGSNVLTQEVKLNYLRPSDGEELVARAEVVHASKRRAVCRCEVFAVSGGEEVLTATGMGTIAAAGSR